MKSAIEDSKSRKFELFFRREMRVNGKFNSGDTSCIMACPAGWVLVEVWHENPQNSHDCEGGTFSCAELAIREVQ